MTMRTRLKIVEGLTVMQSDDPSDPPALLLDDALPVLGHKAEKVVHLSTEERNLLVLALMGKAGKRQFAIEHPRESLLALDYKDEEVWTQDDFRLVLFLTPEEAQVHIDVRAKKWPQSDWPNVRVVEYIPGVKIYPSRRPVETPKRPADAEAG